MADDSFRVRCVLVDGADKPTDPMEEAFKTLDTQGFKPEWYTEPDCLEVTQKEKNCAYIFDPFEGEAFQYISSLGCRVLGPQCILTALHYKMEIPRRRSPVHNLAMKNVIVCCTSMEKTEREEIYIKVDLMGGTSSKDFTEEVTHLIAKEVGSKKYQVAVSLGKEVMIPDWIAGVWNIAKLRHVHATDGQFQKYKCSIFRGLVICVSGLDTIERKEVRKLVEQEGGIYSGDMKMNHCTHLIINEPQGQKYEFAKRWNVMVIRSEWVYDCIEKGHYIEETKYIVREGRGSDGLQITSTPEKENGQGGVSCLADISSISNVSMAHMSHVNETAIANNTIRRSMIEVDPVLNLDICKAPSGLFLDGCKIYLGGFQGPSLEKVRKLINSGGGTRFNTINESVTHVVMGGVTDRDISALNLGNFRPHIVSSFWLVECFKKGYTVDEASYTCVELPPLESNSPKPKSKRKSEVKQQQKVGVKTAAEPLDDEMDIMSQYLPQPDPGMATSRETTVIEPLPVGIDFDEDMTQDPVLETKGDGEAGTGLFRQKSFMIFGFEEDDTNILTEYIVELGGKVLSGHSRTVPYYGIVPLNGFQMDRTVREVVTNAWLQMCLEQNALLEVSSNELFTPVEIIDDTTPLAECVISVSGYTGAERDCLMHLAQLLGATCQEYFVRNANKGFEPNTHLIVKEPEGSKYQAAMKWGLPIVSKKWLLACAKSGKKEPESRYPVVSSANTVHEQEQMEVPNLVVNSKHSNKDMTEKIPQENIQTKHATSDAMEVDAVKIDERPVTCDRDNKTETLLSIEKTLKQKVVKNSVDSKTVLQTASKETGISKKEVQKNDKISQDSQKENKSHKTVISHLIGSDSSRSIQLHTVNHNRVTELQNEQLSTPKMLGSNKRMSLDSPVLEPFDLTSCMEALGSPVGPSHRKTNRRKSTLPLDELFIKQVEAALKTHSLEDSVTSVGDNKDDANPMEIVMAKSQPLAGVIIAVSKKLTLQQAELNDIVAELGGDYKWTYDSACTHFIFQGKTNDMSKEFRLARQQNKIIVSPYWVHACMEKEAKVEEVLYPQNYNPNLSLKMNTPARTPGRYSRKTRLGSKTETETEKKDLNEILALATESRLGKPSKKAGSAIVTGGEPRHKNEEPKQADLEDVSKAARTKVIPDTTCEGSDHTGTLEMTEMMTKELENIMNSSKPKKHGQRRSKKHNSSGQLETSGTSAVDCEVEAEKRITRRSSKGSETHSGPEQSQSLQVTWDDPTGRLEQEKLAHKLERAFSPTQEVDNLDGLGLEEDAQFSDVEQVQLPDLPENTNIEPVHGEEERTPTPDAPKIAFPMPKQPVKLASPQPMKIEDSHVQVNDNRPPYVFILSGMSQEERDDYGALVEQLGGKMLDLQNYDPQCTHLVVGTPARNEKFLACVAAGKWVLHKSYFEACRQENSFALEDFYEWGGDGTASLLQTLNPQVVRLASAAYRWRRKIQVERKKNPKCHGAFGGWEVVLCTDRNKEANFRRLLVAGGANVLSIKPPFTKTVEATHAFLEPSKVPISEEDIECLTTGNVLCLRPDFIASHLTANPAPLPNDFCPPEVSSVLKRFSKTSTTNSKRKSGLSVSSTSSHTKRTRKY